MKQSNNHKRNLSIVLAIVLVLAIGAIGTLAYLTASLSGDKAVVNTFVGSGGLIDPENPDPGPDPEPGVDIDDGFYLLESAVKYENNNYAIDPDAKQVLTNNYDKVAPAMVIPKDPALTVNLVDGVDAYIFIKVIDTANSNLSYTVDSSIWTEVTGLTLNANEKVYCYQNAVQTGTADVEINDVGILTSNQVTAASTLNDIDGSTDGMQLGELRFEAYACQAGGFASPAAAYTACFGN